MKKGQIKLNQFENDAVIKSIRQAIRAEVEREYKKRDVELTHFILNKLLQDCKIEIIPNRNYKESVQYPIREKRKKR
jgi:hypothetical protein